MHTAEHAADAIIALINSRAQSPTKDELVAIILDNFGAGVSPRSGTASLPPNNLVTRIREALARAEEAYRPLASSDCDEKAVDRALVDLDAVEAQLSNPPRSDVDVLSRALIAFFWTNKEDGQMRELDSDDRYERSAARLIECVLQFCGNMGSPPVTRDVAARREEWRRLAAELDAACKISGDLVESTPEGAAAAAVTQEVAARYKISCEQLWAVPPGQADIRLLAEVFYHQMHGDSSLTAPDADDRLAAGSPSYGGPIDEAQAALLKAIREQFLSGPSPSASGR